MEGFIVALREMLVERCLDALCRGGCRIIVYLFGATAYLDRLMQYLTDNRATQKSRYDIRGRKQQGFEFINLQIGSEMAWVFQDCRQVGAQSVGRFALEAVPESVEVV